MSQTHGPLVEKHCLRDSYWDCKNVFEHEHACFRDCTLAGFHSEAFYLHLKPQKHFTPHQCSLVLSVKQLFHKQSTSSHHIFLHLISGKLTVFYLSWVRMKSQDFFVPFCKERKKKKTLINHIKIRLISILKHCCSTFTLSYWHSLLFCCFGVSDWCFLGQVKIPNTTMASTQSLMYCESKLRIWKWKFKIWTKPKICNQPSFSVTVCKGGFGTRKASWQPLLLAEESHYMLSWQYPKVPNNQRTNR